MHAVLHPFVQVLDIEGTPLLGTGEVAIAPAGLAAAAAGDVPAAAAAAPGAALGPAAGVGDVAGVKNSASCMARKYSTT